MTTEKEELFADFPQTYIEKLRKRIDYLEKILRQIDVIPYHILETMTPLEKLVASGRRKGGWCAYCGEYPPVKGFLVAYSCENCTEREPVGGLPCLACGDEHDAPIKVCIKCARKGWCWDSIQGVHLDEEAPQ